MNSRATRRLWWSLIAGVILVGLVTSAALANHFSLLRNGQATLASQVKRVATQPVASGSYLYYVLKQSGGFVLARAQMGADGQPVGTPQVVASFGDDFGQSIADLVISLQLSPDGKFLAIDGTHSDGELVWVFNTTNLKLTLEPPTVSGTFLHWLPGLGDEFLYRPMFPRGPGTPLTSDAWNPGLWLVNAITGGIVNINIGVPSTFLVDAIGSPDGSQVVYSTTAGLGTGSDVWSVDLHTRKQAHLLRLADSPQSIAGVFTWSPDGQTIAYERMADSPTPFLPSGLWIMNRQGGGQRLLAQADGGHGFPLRWSPDGKKIAFVARTNATSSMADQSTQALRSAIDVVDVGNGHVTPVATPAQTGVQINANPVWSPDSSSITFTAYNPLNPAIGGTVHYWSVSTRPTAMHPSATQLSQPVTHVVALLQYPFADRKDALTGAARYVGKHMLVSRQGQGEMH